MPPDADQHRPLVVSLEIDDAAQARFDAERAALFPPGRTVLGAHLTLFHAVPASIEAGVRADLAAVTGAGRPLPIVVSELMPLGRGVAYRLRSAELLALHRGLQQRWQDCLTAQDRQGFRPHVTVQNKVDPELARQTLAQLRAGFTPFATTGWALRLWRYEGGPWSPLARFAFGSGPPAAAPPAVPDAPRSTE